MARRLFRGRFQASALPLVKPRAVLRSARLLEGPGSLARHWFRGRFQAAFWAPGRAEAAAAEAFAPRSGAKAAKPPSL